MRGREEEEEEEAILLLVLVRSFCTFICGGLVRPVGVIADRVFLALLLLLLGRGAWRSFV